MSAEQIAALICAWLVTYLAHSVLFLGGAWLGCRRLSSRFDRVAEPVWRMALVLPVLTATTQHFGRVGTTRVASAVPLDFAPAAMTVSAVPAYVWFGITLVWIAGAGLGLTQLALLFGSLRRVIKGRNRVPTQRLIPLQSLRGMSSTRISVVDGLAVPLALMNEICLPPWVVQSMNQDEYRAVIAHELAHVTRRDAIWRPLAAVISRIFFFQPLNWVATARLRELSECICDEEAVEATRCALPLASALNEVARRNSRRARKLELVPAMDASRSFTLRRIARILRSSHSPPPRIDPGAAAVLAIAIGLGGVVLAPTMTLPEIAFQRYTINAEDPAGRFTVTVEKGRVVGATISGRGLEPHQLIQQGRSLRIIDRQAGPFSVQLTPQGGIRWDARKRGT